MNIIHEILNSNSKIETERLLIYPGIIEGRKLADLFEIYNNKSNVTFFTSPLNDIDKFVDLMLDKIERHQNKDHGYICFFIEIKEHNKIIGFRNLILDGAYTKNGARMDNNENLITEIIINKKYWGKNYGFEASNAIFQFLKSNKIRLISSFINRENLPAIKLSQKLGFNQVDSDTLLRLGFHKDFTLLCNDLEDSLFQLKEL